MSLGHMTYQSLDFHRTHNKEQGMNYGLELIDLANLDDKLELSQYLTYWLWLF